MLAKWNWFLYLYLQNGFYRCQALQCIGDLIADHPKNLEELTNKRLGEEPALNSVLRILSHPSSEQESMAVDYLFKNCQVGILTEFLLTGEIFQAVLYCAFRMILDIVQQSFLYYLLCWVYSFVLCLLEIYSLHPILCDLLPGTKFKK